MKKASNPHPAPIPLLTYIPALVLGACAMGLVIWAVLKGPLWPDQKPLMNVMAALLCGTAGFLWGGVVLEMVWQPDPRMRVAIQAVGAAAIFVFLMVHPIYPAESQRSQTAGGDTWLPPTGVSIIEPSKGSMVDADIPIRGRASYAGLHYYCLVKAESVGGAAIQDGELVRSESGELAGKARIGTAGAGAGETYTLTIVGSDKLLHAGPLRSTDGLIWSNQVTVRRIAPEQRKQKKL
jgi:hypothetical protein